VTTLEVLAMIDHRVGRGFAVVVGMCLVLGAGGGTASADTHLSGSGLTGRHSLRDRAGSPGVTCDYSVPSGWFHELTVRAPKVFARNRTASRDHQQVRWSLRVDYWDVNGYWAQATGEGPWTARAWDDTPAAFTASTFPAPTGLGGRYRVVIKMRWLRAGAEEGRSVHRVDYYRNRMGGDVFVSGPHGFCTEVWP
jgi:hypothetical protein